MHIGLTYFFYVDRDARPVIAAQRTRFLVMAPLVLIAFFVAFMLSNQLLRSWIMIGVGVWTIWHFQKQNLGVYALIGLARGDPPMSAIERQIIIFAGVAGMPLNAVGYGDGLKGANLLNLAPALLTIGLVLQIAVGIAALFVIYRDRGSLSIRHVFLLTFAFNWATFLFLPYVVAWVSSGLGHGLQYVFIMLMVGARSKNTIGVPKLPAWAAPSINAAIVFLIGVLFFEFARRVPMWPPKAYSTEAFTSGLNGLALAVTIVHYVLDAGIWRLSRSEARNYMRTKLDFLFTR
jgi:hypothetical protein